MKKEKVTITHYICELCNTAYICEDDAMECESRPLMEAKYKPGDRILVLNGQGKGDHYEGIPCA